MNSLPGQRSLLPKLMYAEFSDDRIYRYSLTRIWKRDGRYVNFIMLNPSTADEVNNDATIRRCLGFADAWGYHGIIVTNLFALRTTAPSVLKTYPDPVGPMNDQYIIKQANQCDRVICAWGNHGSLMGRDQTVIKLLRDRGPLEISCLTITKSGHPGHPLRLNSVLVPQPWVNLS